MTHHDEVMRNDTQAVTYNRRKKRKSGKGWLILLLLVAAVVWFAPTIIAKTDLRNKLIGWAAPDFPGQVSIRDASAGWLSPLELRDVTVTDSDGQLVAQVPLISSSKQLSEIATNYKDLGTFKLHQPQVSIIVTQESSNLEELLHPFTDTTAEGSTATNAPGKPIAFGLVITEGKALITDAVTQQTCTVDNLELQMKLPNAPPEPLTVNLSADAEYQARRGSLSTNVAWQQPSHLSATDLGDGHVQLISQGFPLAALQPLWRRASLDLDLHGQLVSNMDCRWSRTNKGPELQAAGTVGIEGPQVRMPSALGNDQISLQQANATIDAQIVDNMVNLRGMKIQSDLANLEISGSAMLNELMADQPITTLLTNWQSSHVYQVKGNVDVAATAAQLPETLNLKQGMTITQGQASLDLNSRMELGQRVITGTVQTDRIAAVSNGRTVTWDQPIHLAVAGVSNMDGLQLQRLDCQSDFLNVSGSGTLASGQLQATGDLSKLVEQLGQFCDLGDLQMAGRMTANGSWKTMENTKSQGTLNAEFLEFSMVSSQIPPIREQQLTLQATALGNVNATDGLQSVDSGSLQILTGEDRMAAALTEPVVQPTAESVWPLQCQLTGYAESWLARLRPWGITIPDWEIRSKIQATGSGNFHAQQVDLASCKIGLQNLSASSPGLLIREPNVQLDGSLTWKAAGNEISSPSLTFTSSTIALRAENLLARFDGDQTAASGAFAFRGDLGRLAAIQYADTPPTSRARGAFQGQAQLSTQNGTISFQGNTDVTNFVYEDLANGPQAVAAGPNSWKPVWSEPNLRLSANGQYQPASDQLNLQKLDVVSNGLALAAAGNLTSLTAKPQASLTGEISYDLAVIAAKLGPQLGPDVQLVGQHRQPFTISGPLVADSLAMASPQSVGGPDGTQLASAAIPSTAVISNDLTAETTLAWDNVQAYGVTMGPQAIRTKLQQGTVFFSPLSLAVEGMPTPLSVAPRLELNATPMALVVDPGKIVENMQITPEMCSTWFKYITPALAGAATAEGQLSVSLQGARVPLDNPMAANVQGQAEILGARVQPGPMASQLLGTIQEVAGIVGKAAPSLKFLEQGNNLLELAPQTIDFQMANGRVFHRNMELTSGNVIVRTQGWVGVDQSVGLLAEIPILDKWVENEKLLSGLKGQTIKIPVAGTLTKPQLDRRAIGQLSQQLLGGAAQQLIQGELQKGLQKLLGQ